MKGSSFLGSTVVALLFAAACGDDAGGGEESIAIEEFPTEIARAQCALVESCFAAYAPLLGAEDCFTLAERAIENRGWPQFKAAVEKGDAKYDGSAAAACLAEISAQSCDAARIVSHQARSVSCRLDFTPLNCKGLSNWTSETCGKASEGKVERGGTCIYDFECTGQAFCKFEGSCPGSTGTCTDPQPFTPPTGFGPDCDDDGQCADGLVCRNQPPECVQPAALGETCETSYSPCAGMALCLPDLQSKQGRCKSFDEVFVGNSGDACDLSGSLCTADLTCVIDNPTDLTGKCQPIASSGGPCHAFSIPNPCPTGEWCASGSDGFCAPLPDAGQPCAYTYNEPHFGCAAYMRCEGLGADGAVGKCSNPVQNNGFACQSSAGCYSDHCVNGVCDANYLCAQ